MDVLNMFTKKAAPQPAGPPTPATDNEPRYTLAEAAKLIGKRGGRPRKKTVEEVSAKPDLTTRAA